MKKLFLIACLLILTGCANWNFYKNSEPVIVDKQINFDPKLLQPCATLVNTPILVIEDLLLENLELYKQYALCARKQQDSINILQQLGTSQ